MFIRTSRSGGHTYLRLVASYRDADGKNRHRQIAQLGRAEDWGEEQVETFVRGLRRVTGHETAPEGAPEFEAARELGGPWVLTELWRALGMDAALQRALRSARRAFDAEGLIRMMVFNRLCDPESKLGVLRWLEGVVMPGLDTAAVSHQHLLRAMDALEGLRAEFSAHMAKLLRPLIDTELSVVFYDLTTLRIHGETEIPDDIRAYGRNKQTDGVARQVLLGLVQTADGLPLDFEIFEGNAAEVHTLLPMVQRVRQRYPIKRVVLVADRGLLSLHNLEALEAMANGPDYILAVPAGRYKDFAETIAAMGFDDAEPSIRETEHEGRRLVVAHDPTMAEAARWRRRDKLDELVAYGDRLAAKLDAQDAGQNSRGRRASDRGAYARFQKALIEAKFSRFIQPDIAAERFSFTVNQAALDKAETLDGKLVLLTSVRDLDAETVVARYKALADIERGFRVLKQDIAIAPVYHRLPQRLWAHGAICFLALILHRVMRLRLKQRNAPYSVERAFHHLKQVQRHRMRHQGKTLTGITTLSAEQKALFHHLDVPPPRNHAL